MGTDETLLADALDLAFLARDLPPDLARRWFARLGELGVDPERLRTAQSLAQVLRQRMDREAAAITDASLEAADALPGPPVLDFDRVRAFFERLRQLEDDYKLRQRRCGDLLGQIESTRRAVLQAVKDIVKAERQPADLPREKVETLLASDDEVIAGVRELDEEGGLELDQFLEELRQTAADGP